MLEIINYNENIAQLLTKDTSCIYFSCVLEGTMEGCAWVDSLEAPTFAVVWDEYQKGFQLMGKAVEESEYSNLKVFFETIIFQMLREKGLDYFECGTDSDELTKMLFDIFRDKNMDSEQQKVFHLKDINSLTVDIMTKIDHEYDVVAIDASFLTKNYDNIEYVTEEIDATWKSTETYLNRGYGYAAIINNQVVGRALVTCSYKEYDNIGVDTLEAYRRMGISTVLVHKTLLEAKKRNRKSIWDCMEENIASERTALKVGFELGRTYTICWFGIGRLLWT